MNRRSFFGICAAIPFSTALSTKSETEEPVSDSVPRLTWADHTRVFWYDPDQSHWLDLRVDA